MRTLLPALRLSLLAGAAGLSSVPPKGPGGAFGKGKFGGGKFGGPADPRGVGPCRAPAARPATEAS